MSKYIIDSSTLTDIADAIREKAVITEAIDPVDMPQKILDIQTDKHYATIAVSTDFLFDQPVTVSSTELGYTRTKVFDAQGNADFIVNDWGTYTITSEGYTVKVAVSEWYQTYYVDLLGEVEITFTVEGAKGDNITIKNEGGEIVRNLIFSTSETSQTVTMVIPPDGETYTFASSVAKATDGTANNFEKTATITSDMPFTKITPDGYEDLKYIESTGTQYINTNFTPNSNTKVEAVFYKPSESVKALFGARTSSVEDAFVITSDTGSNLSMQYGNSHSWISNGSGQSVPSNSLVEITFDKNSCKVVCNGAEYSHALSASSFTCKYPMYIFALNQANSVTQQTSSKVYSFKIYDNGVLVRDYIPCRRTLDNSVGLYDMVANEFYGNSGTGTFTAGERTDLPKVKVMPDGSVIYWYGNQLIQMDFDTRPWDAGWIVRNQIVQNTNSFNFAMDKPNKDATFWTAMYATKDKIDISGYAKLKARIKQSELLSNAHVTCIASIHVYGDSTSSTIAPDNIVGSSYLSVYDTADRTRFSGDKELDLPNNSNLNGKIGLRVVSCLVNGNQYGYIPLNEIEALWLE